MDPLAAFTEPTRAWFAAAFEAPTAIQRAAWPAIQHGRHVLAVAPTGSGKTLAAFLWSIDRCALPHEGGGVRVLYVSPLKALAVDVERNLRGPLAGITAQHQLHGRPPPAVTVAMRTGDSTAQERRALVKHPPDVLITTPESLFLLLTSQARSILHAVDTIIVDEVHALTGTKRGAHLAVSLARIDHLAGRRPQRVGLSATVHPTGEAARFLGGDLPVDVVTVPTSKRWEVRVEVPVADMSDPGGGRDDAAQSSPSIWPAVEGRIVDLIEGHRSTIVFANSRRLAERITARVNEISAERQGLKGPEDGARPPAMVMAQSGSSSGAPPVLARAHHGSVSKEQRALIEDDLKTGRLRAVVATSSLELGIDMGAVDLVIQVGSPPTVASGLQRVGRAGHRVGATSTAVVLPTHRADLLTSAVVLQRMVGEQLETLRVPSNPLDIAAQHVVSCVAMDDWRVADLLALLRSTAPFTSLTPALFESVVEMLSGRYPSDAFAHLRPRLVWDRADDVLRARPGAQRLAVTSGGTIPDRGLFGVFLVGGGRVGELDEEMVYESRVGDRISLGASSWLINDITHDRVLVVPAPGAPGRLPFWRGDSVGRSAELGAAIGRFTRTLASMTRAEATPWLRERGLDRQAADNLAAYVGEQVQAAGHVPTDRTILVERTRDELGDWRIAVLTPFGARVHAPWALLARERLKERFNVDPDILHGDEGIVARLPETADDDDLTDVVDCMLPDPDLISAEVTRLVGSSALFAARFRECASRALLLPRSGPDRRSPLWQQRQRSAQLLQIAAEHPTFPIVLEAVRECVQDVYDLDALTDVLTRVRDRRIRVVEVAPPVPSPFARSLLFGYVAQYLYEGDSPLAERRAAALMLDPSLLSELLGHTDLRDLLDQAAIEDVVAVLQHLTPERRARGPEDAVDVLRLLGPLDSDGAGARGIEMPWLNELERQNRVFRTRLRGTLVWACVEDASRVRDALGAPVPPGLAEAHLVPVPDPVGDVISRYARTHGPFRTADASESLGLPPAVVAERLGAARSAGRVVEGQFIAALTGSQWCHPEVLRMIKRRSYAHLRHQIEPVPQSALAEFLIDWQGIGARADPGGEVSLQAAIRQLAGVPMPASALESSILPLRVPGYEPRMLDHLTSTGEVVWCGVSALPGGDGWVCLAPADLAFLLPRSDDDELSALEVSILDLLDAGGGWFLSDLAERLPGLDSPGGPEPGTVAAAIERLMWAGKVSNDTLGPVRSLSPGHRPGTPRPPSARPPRGRYAGLWHPPRFGPGSREVAAGASQPGGPGTGSRLRGLAWTPRTGGRWFSLPRQRPHDVAEAVASVGQHLERLGLVTRSAILASGDEGGFAAAYRTLSAMEDAGAVQRVYAVEGLGASQFALPGVVDRLREITSELETGDPRAVVLAAADPANAYGTSLEWPASGRTDAHGHAHRPTRSAGAFVVLVRGEPELYVERGGRSLFTFGTHGANPLADVEPNSAASRLDHAARALVDDVKAGRVPPLLITRINGVPALSVRDEAAAPVAEALSRAGFIHTPRGLRARR